MIASVSGRRMVKVEPAPSVEATSTRPRDGLDVSLDDVHADAAARDVGDFFGGGEARAKSRSKISDW